jgi:predicted TPR repeat methyltransferase
MAMAEPDPRYARAAALHQAGRLDEAVQAYREVPDESPYAFKALNNLGTVLEGRGRLDEAIEVYRRAVELRPDSEVPLYNLAFGLHQQNRLAEAIESYRAALRLNPGLTLARYNLGNALFQCGRYEAAAEEFRQAARDEPGSAAGLRRLGDAWFKLRRIPEARQAYERALQLEPNSAGEHFNVGKVLHLAGEPERAIAAYRRSIELDLRQSAPYENLGRLLSRLGRRDEAAEVYRQWSAASPGNPAPAHLLAALTGEGVPARAADAYVRTAFDHFAEEFDATLERLNYRAPQLLAESLAGVAGPPQKQLDLLDAGCGTGLCGPLLAPYARRLVGVDLSGAMLAKALERGVYDGLREAEITEFLRSAAEGFDAIVAADVFVYFGDLHAAFRDSAAALRDGGWLLFTLEHLQDARGGSGFRLNPHGRYSHTQEYIVRELGDAGLTSVSISHCVLRTEGGDPVEGLLVVARKERA